MLSRITGGGVRYNTQASRLVLVRTIFVVGSDKKSNKQRRHADEGKSKFDRFLDNEAKRKAKEEEKKYKEKLTELRQLTKTVSSIIRINEEKELELEKMNKIPLPSDVKKEEEEVYQALTSLPAVVKPHSLIATPVALPEPILDRLGLAVRYLVSSQSQNWELVLHQLSESGGFSGIEPKYVTQFIQAIPVTHLKGLVPHVELLLQEAKRAKSDRIITILMRATASGPNVTDEEITVLEEYTTQFKNSKKNKSGNLNKEVFEIMIEAYGKNKNMEKVNECLAEMKKLLIAPSPRVFSNILATTVYKTRNHKQAVEIFDSMKFFSQSTKPGTRAYQDIIVSHVNNDDVERAIDLYQEMMTYRIPTNQSIMVALARGCSSRPEMRYKSWDFMFEIYNNGWTPTLESFEYMLYLSSKDGDLALSRALYLQLVKSNATAPRSFSFLLMAYAKSKVKTGNIDPHLLVFHEKGRVFRRNIIEDADMANLPPTGGVPFLPLQDLTTKHQLLAESSALWGHAMINHRGYINIHSTTTFINIASEVGNLDDFKDRFDSATYLEETGIPKTRQVVDEPELIEIMEEEAEEEAKPPSFVKSPILQDIEQHQTQARVPRSSLMYVVALKAAGKFNNYDFAQQIWVERGSYRKTTHFRSMPQDEREKLDFQFASSMITCLTQLNLLEEALAILISTEYQFKWTWKELNILYKAAFEVGHDKVCQTVRGVAKRAQINFAGKIRKKDYKKYVMERGY